MEFKILGPFEVSNEHGAVALGGVKPRAVLAVLLLNANEPVSAERLAQALWGDDVPAGAVKAVQVHVSRLRKALGNGDVVETTRAGYRLHVRPGELDAELFQHLVEDGRQALAAGQPEQAAAVLREALTLWRGSPLAELAFEPFAQAEIARLDEQRLAAVEARVEADLAAGREAELIGELQQLVAVHPTRERLAGQLMLALYRCGRQAEALEAYGEARRVLVAEIGVEPGPELRRLQDAILRQDASLEPELVVADLPRELDAAAAPPLEGRRAELAWLRDRWEQARTGSGVLVTVHGEHGIGKSRLSAELAGEAHAAGAAVVYAAGTGPTDAVLGVLVRARGATRPTLVVIDDADRAGDDVRASLVAMPQAVADVPVLVLVLSGDGDAGALARLPPDGSLLLQPLDVDAVHAIAVRYAPGHLGQDVPAEWLLDASGGVPLRVHELASQWARREAARRVGAVAEQAKVGRAELRSMEDELAVGVVDLQAAGEHLALVTDDDAPVVCPFKGLASFDVADAPYFFGREQLVAELVARSVGAPLLGVVGPSGSGKSSVVRAGLLPALASGVLPDSEHWTQVLVRPGEHPLRELRDAVTGLPRDRRMLIAVDQFEETFTTCRDEEERAAFIAALARAAGDPHEQAVVVIAIRADYYGRCAAYPELSSLLAANHVLVRPMQSDELRRAIELPAHRAGLRVEPELTDALVADTEAEPGALPLLSTALLELWQRRHGRRLRHADYERMGGVRAAVARLAEGAFERLDDAQKTVARGVFMRLAGEGAEGAVERRRVPLAEFETGDEDGARVVALLTDQRLLTATAGSVEVAHEALLREWPRLRQWIEEDREGLRIHRRMTAAAQEWRRLDRDDDALYRGTALTEALEWRAGRDPTLNQLERDFLDAGAARRQRVRAARRRRIELAFAALIAALAAITVVAVVAIHQRRDAVQVRNVAVSRELALQSEKEVDVDPELAVRLALLALDRSRTEEADAAVRQGTLAFRQVAALPADSLSARTAAYSPDGTRVVTGGKDGIARVFDTRSRRLVGQLGPGHHELLAARYSPQGLGLALGFSDGTLLVTNSSLGAGRTLLRLGKAINSLAFTRDGKRVAVASGDGKVRVLAVDGSGRPLTLSAGQGAVLGVDINADASRVVSAGNDRTVRLWNLSDGGGGQLLYTAKRKETDVAFSPDGSRVIAVGYDGWLRIWDGRTGASQARMRGGTRELTSTAFSSDGRRFGAGGWDGVVRVWSVSGGSQPVAVLHGQGSRVMDLGFGAASDRAVSAGDDGKTRIWNAGRTQSWVVPSLTDNLDFSRDGRLLLSASEDGTVRIWNAATAELRQSMPGPEGFTPARFSPTADDVLIARYATSSVLLWPLSAEAAKPLVRLPQGSGMYFARFDGTGHRIVYADATGRVAVRDLRSGREVRLGGAPKEVFDARISPDGSHVAAGTESGALLVWRVDRPDRPEVLRGHHGHVSAVAYSPDGSRIVTAGTDRTVRVWNPRDGTDVVLRGSEDEINTAIFSNDGNHVLSASADGTLQLWDARGGQALAILTSGGGPLYDVALSRDGKIATLGENNVVRVFKCEVCGSLEQVRALARSRAPGQLTPDERQRFLAGAR